MKARLSLCLLAHVLASPAYSQVEIPGRNPAHPEKFTTRSTGGASTGGIQVTPAAPPKVKHVTHLVLTEDRQWTSTDGKPLVGRLIAFEDLIAESEPGATTPPATPAPPTHPTVVREGKIRLLVKAKAYELALDRLSAEDRTFVEEVRSRYQMPYTRP